MSDIDKIFNRITAVAQDTTDNRFWRTKSVISTKKKGEKIYSKDF